MDVKSDNCTFHLHEKTGFPRQVITVRNKITNLLLSNFTEIKSEDDLIPPGAKAGTIPTDFSQATGLERLELIGKMQGIDIFDMRPLDASRKGM